MEALSSSLASVLQEPHGVTSQKTPFFVVIAVKISTLTKYLTCFTQANWYNSINFNVDSLHCLTISSDHENKADIFPWTVGWLSVDYSPVKTSSPTINQPTKSSYITACCKIWSVYRGDKEECLFLGCGAVWVLLEPTFLRNLSPPSSGWKRISELGMLALTSKVCYYRCSQFADSF
jgi:hypothetical protein